MIKNKIAVGLGLILGLTTSISFADVPLQGTDLVTSKNSQTIPLNGLKSHTYYNITCYPQSYSKSGNMGILVEQNSLKYSNWGPNYFNGTATDMDGGMVKAIIGPDSGSPSTDKIEFRNVIFYDAQDAKFVFSVDSSNYPGVGYAVKCDPAVLVKDDAK